MGGGRPPAAETDPGRGLERRGRVWLALSFLFCPCHLPLTLGALAAVFGGTFLGVSLREGAWAVGVVLTAAWVSGTGYGLWLIRRAERARGCPVPVSPPRPR